MKTMRAAVFVRPGRIELRERPIPEVGPMDALVRITTTTICGTDAHILKGEVFSHQRDGVLKVAITP